MKCFILWVILNLFVLTIGEIVVFCDDVYSKENYDIQYPSNVAIVLKEDASWKPVQRYKLFLNKCEINEDFSSNPSIRSVSESSLTAVKTFIHNNISATILRQHNLRADEVSDKQMELILNYPIKDIAMFINHILHVKESVKSEIEKYYTYSTNVNILYIAENLPLKIECLLLRNQEDLNEFDISCETIPNLKKRTTFINTTLNSFNALPLYIPANNLNNVSLSQYLTAYNQIIPVIYENSVSNMDLKLLKLELCEIEHILPTAFQNLKLELMEISRNPLQTLRSGIFKNVTITNRLHFDHNKISVIEPRAFDGLTASFLDLSHNNIEKINKDLWQIKKLKFLLISYNKIKTILPGIFEGLQWVNLAFNEIHHIDPYTFKNVDSGAVVSLLGNSLTQINEGTFRDISLHELDLSNNRIDHIDNKAFTNSFFRHLNLNYNNLQNITTIMFAGSSIHNLRLISNRIENIEPHSFELISNLSTIDLEINDVKVLKTGTITGNDLLVIHLLDNNITKIEPNAINAPKMYLIRININNIDNSSKINLGKYLNITKY